MNLNDRLFQRIKAVYDDRDNLGLTDVQKRVVEKYYRSFAEQGAALPREKGAADKGERRALQAFRAV